MHRQKLSQLVVGERRQLPTLPRTNYTTNACLIRHFKLIRRHTVVKYTVEFQLRTTSTHFYPNLLIFPGDSVTPASPGKVDKLLMKKIPHRTSVGTN